MVTTKTVRMLKMVHMEAYDHKRVEIIPYNDTSIRNLNQAVAAAAVVFMLLSPLKQIHTLK